MFRQSKILAASALALAMVCGTALAAQPHAQDSRHARFEQRLAQLHAKLHLNGEEEKLWNSALATMRQNRATEHANRRQMRAQFEAAQKQPVLDLNAMNSARENAMQQSEQLHQQTAAAWLNFYNALDTQQKTTVSTALKNHWAKMAKMRARWHQRHARMAQRHAASAAAAQ